MRKYDNLLSAIEASFSAEVGASPETVVHFSNRLKVNPKWRKTLISEISESLKDSSFSWRGALWTDYSHVFEADSEEHARQFVVENILKRAIDCEGEREA